jgi:hypothetical protein
LNIFFNFLFLLISLLFLYSKEQTYFRNASTFPARFRTYKTQASAFPKTTVTCETQAQASVVHDRKRKPENYNNENSK